MEKELNEIFELATLYQDKGLREGQSFSNAVMELQPYLSAGIDGTEIDCFYQDENVDACLIYVMKELGKCSTH